MNQDPALFSDAPAPEDSHLFSDAPAPEQQGPLESAARGALRNFPLAQQGAAAAAPLLNKFGLSEKPTYGAELQHLTEAAEAGKAQNPKSYIAGAAAGTLAPLAIPGAGEALEAAPFLGNAALNAVQSQSDTNLTKPTMANAKEAGIAALIGGGLGKAGSMIKGAPEAALAAPAAEEVAPIAETAAKLQPKAEINGIAVPNKTVAPDFSPSAERVYASNLAKGLGGTPRQLLKVFGKEDPVQSLNNLGNWMETAGENGKSLHGYLDRPGELLEKINNIHDKAGQTIGDIIDKVGVESPTAEAAGYPSTDKAGLMKELNDFALNTADPQTEARITKLIRTADHLETKKVSDFEMVQQLKEMAGKQIAKDSEMAPVYGALADRMSKTVDDYGAAIQNPELKAIYDKAKLDYHNASRILPILRYSEAKELTGGAAGHFSLRSLLSTIVNTAAGITGAPPTEQIGKNIMLKTAPAARAAANRISQGLNRANEASKSMNTAAQMELANALQAKFGKVKR